MNTVIGCSIIIHDEEGKVLIARRSENKKHYPLLWELVGGELKDDETPEGCIRREVAEEINCGISNLSLFNAYVVKEEGTKHILVVYSGKLEGEPQANEEIKQLEWIKEEEIEKYIFMGNDREKLLDYYAQELKRNGIAI